MRPAVPFRLALAVSLLLGTVGCGSRAVPTLTPEPGVRVRLSASHPDVRQYDGTIVALPADSIAVDTLRIALAAVTRLELHGGQKSHWLPGMGIGFLAGGLAGLGIGYATCAPCEGELDVLAPFFGTLIGAGAGLISGAVIGSQIKSDRWNHVPLDRLRVGFGRLGDVPFGLSLSLAF